MRESAKAIGMREENLPIIRLAFMVADNLDWKTNRPLAVETVANKLGVRPNNVARMCKSLGLCIEKRGKAYYILTKEQLESAETYGSMNAKRAWKDSKLSQI